MKSLLTLALIGMLLTQSAMADLKTQAARALSLLRQQPATESNAKEIAGWEKVQGFLAQVAQKERMSGTTLHKDRDQLYFDNLHRFGRLLTQDSPELRQLGETILEEVPWGRLTPQKLYPKTREHLTVLLSHPAAEEILKGHLAKSKGVRLETEDKLESERQAQAAYRDYQWRRRMQSCKDNFAAFAAAAAIVTVAGGVVYLAATLPPGPPRASGSGDDYPSTYYDTTTYDYGSSSSYDYGSSSSSSYDSGASSSSSYDSGPSAGSYYSGD